MYVPSFDFRIFDLPFFSPLQAQEFGAATSFSANTPTSFIDYSLNQFTDLLNPRSSNPYFQNQFPSSTEKQNFENYFQSDTPSAARDRLRKLRDQANEVLGETTPQVFNPKQSSNDGCPDGTKRVTRFGGLISYCGKGLISDGDQTLGNKEAPPGMQSVENFFNALPQGAGIFIIGLVIVVLLFLFVKR